MSQVAFTMNGEPFDPSPAALWRVRRVRDRGLEIAYQRGGCTPLFVPIDITPDEFQRLVDFEEGKYRLDPLTEDYQPVEGVPPAYLSIRRSEAAANGNVPPPAEVRASEATAARREPAMSETAELLRMVVKANAKTTRAIAQQYAAVLDAAARVLSAEGANLPARSVYEQQRNAALPAVASAPTEGEEQGDEASDDGDDYDVVRDVCATVRTVVPTLGAVLGLGANALRNRKHPPAPRNEATRGSDDDAPPPHAKTRPASAPAEGAPPPRAKVAESAKPATAPSPTPARAEVPIGLRFLSIKEQLTTEELGFAFAVYQELTEDEKETWKQDLADMSDEEVVAMIQAKYRGDENDLVDDDNPNQEDEEEDEIDGSEVEEVTP